MDVKLEVVVGLANMLAETGKQMFFIYRESYHHYDTEQCYQNIKQNIKWHIKATKWPKRNNNSLY